MDSLGQLSLDRLRSFVAFAEHLNFTHAARSLNTSQPALHTQIRRLEDELGQRLYRREGRALVLTPAGKRALRSARAVTREAAALVAELAGEAPRPVILAAGAGAYQDLLGEGLAAYLRAHPRGLELLTLDGADARAAVAEGAADVAVVAGPALPEHDPGRRLAQVPQVVVLPARHRLARRAHVRLAELGGEPLVMPPPGGPQRALLDGAFATHGVTPQVVVEARGWPLVLEFARMGMGLAVVNATCTIPAGLTARLLQGVPAVDYRVLGGAGRGAELGAALRAHRDAWRERRRSGFQLASRAR